MGDRAERSFGVPMASIAQGWRPRRCLRHDQPTTTRRSLLVDNLFDSVVSVQVRHRRIADWPLCGACHKAQRRAQLVSAVISIAALGYMWFLFAHAAGQSLAAQFVLGFASFALWCIAVAVWRRALMPSLSAGLHLSRDCGTLVVKTRLGDPSIPAELDEVSASRWY